MSFVNYYVNSLPGTVLPCDSSPCLNGGVCQRSISDSTAFTCNCPASFRGDTCQEPGEYENAISHLSISTVLMHPALSLSFIVRTIDFEISAEFKFRLMLGINCRCDQ